MIVLDDNMIRYETPIFCINDPESFNFVEKPDNVTEKEEEKVEEVKMTVFNFYSVKNKISYCAERYWDESLQPHAH